MKKIDFINYKDVNFLWVQDHYDIHLSGLCKYKGKLHFFRTDYDYKLSPLKSHIYKLKTPEKICWLYKKKLFEVCVSTHWTYPNYNIVDTKKPRWLREILFYSYYKKIL